MGGSSGKGIRAAYLSFRLAAVRLIWPMRLILFGIVFVCTVLMLVFYRSADKVTSTTMPDDISALVSWLLEEGATLHPCVAVSFCGAGGGRCVMTECPIRSDEELLVVPASAQILQAPLPSAQICPDLDTWLDTPSSEGGGKEWHFNSRSMRLALRLLEEWRLGPKSKWHLYLQTIPKDFPTVMTDENVQSQCLAGTGGQSRVSRRFSRRAAERKLLQRCGSGRKAAEGFNPQVDDDASLLLWASCVIGSRAYSSAKDSDEVLVPFADLFNDNPHPNANWRRDPRDSGGAFRITAARDLPAGEEILISYGAKSNEQLLTRYGFVHFDNEHDTAYVDLLDTDEGLALAGHEARLMLSLAPSVSANALPRSLKVLRSHSKSRDSTPKDGHSESTSEEVAILKRIKDKCSTSAAAFERADVREGGEICKLYRKGVASLSEACAHFAQSALALFPDIGIQEDSLVAPSSAAALALSRQLLQAWRADAVSRGLAQLRQNA